MTETLWLWAMGSSPTLDASATSSTTSTTATSTTTTTVPPTTTTTTTTTSVPPTTTSTTQPHTTSTITTTIAVHHRSSSATPWGLVALVAALVLAIVLVTVLLLVRRSRQRQSGWRRAVLPTLSDARLARDALLSGSAEADDEQLRAAVRLQVERAATALEGTRQRAPRPEDAEAARAAASSLRELAFAIEADRLLRHGARAPTGEQLAEADRARRDRGSELDRAIARLAATVGRGQKHPPR